MKDPKDPGTPEFPMFYDQHLINAVANLETIFTPEGTKATPENEKIVKDNISFDVIEELENKIEALSASVDRLEKVALDLLRLVSAPSQNLAGGHFPPPSDMGGN